MPPLFERGGPSKFTMVSVNYSYIEVRHGCFYLFCCVLLSACVLECLLTMPPTALITGLSQSRRKLDKGPREENVPSIGPPQLRNF